MALSRLDEKLDLDILQLDILPLFESLPDDVVDNIFEFLNAKSLCRCAMVNRYFSTKALGKVLWDKLYLKDFGGLPQTNARITYEPRQAYKKRFLNHLDRVKEVLREAELEERRRNAVEKRRVLVPFYRLFVQYLFFVLPMALLITFTVFVALKLDNKLLPSGLWGWPVVFIPIWIMSGFFALSFGFASFASRERDSPNYSVWHNVYSESSRSIPNVVIDGPVAERSRRPPFSHPHF